MQQTITCPACGADERVRSSSPVDLKEIGLFECNSCSARVVQGTVVPRVVVEPHRDERGFLWLRRRFQDPRTKEDVYVIDVDPQFAASEAKNILSLVIP